MARKNSKKKNGLSAKEKAERKKQIQVRREERRREILFRKFSLDLWPYHADMFTGLFTKQAEQVMQEKMLDFQRRHSFPHLSHLRETPDEFEQVHSDWHSRLPHRILYRNFKGVCNG